MPLKNTKKYILTRIIKKNKYFVKIYNTETKKTNYFRYSKLVKIKDYLLILKLNKKNNKRTSIYQIARNKKSKKNKITKKDILQFFTKIKKIKVKKIKRKCKPLTKIDILNKLNKTKKKQFDTEFIYKSKLDLLVPFKKLIQKANKSKNILKQIMQNPTLIKDNFNIHIEIHGFGKHQDRECKLAQIFIPQANIKKLNSEINLEEITEIESQDEFLMYLEHKYNANIRKTDTGIITKIKITYDLRFGIGKQTKINDYKKK